MNITFSYLYRDAGNYKQHHHETFTNAHNFTLDEIEAFIRTCLIEGEWFYVNEWHLKDLHVHPWDNELDHTYHEFDCVEETTEPPTQTDIVDFLYKIVA